MEAQNDGVLREAYNEGLTVPDGMPLVWMGRLLGRGEVRRVYGPDTTLLLCEAAAREGWRCYFYGGGEGVAAAMSDVLRRRFPGLEIAGSSAPPFRPLNAEEVAAEIRRINEAEPDLVFVGLGSPKQELWMAAHRPALQAAVLLGVGAAFDFHTGRIRQAPRWMMRSGLEWLFRLAQEPRRLWWRYAAKNPAFVARAFLQLLRRGMGGNPPHEPPRTD
jgi:N-acetylglucosaminyldiphosphoundecaprenol N-acetyl-beta-D-mannosaminyltransferase